MDRQGDREGLARKHEGLVDFLLFILYVIGLVLSYIVRAAKTIFMYLGFGLAGLIILGVGIGLCIISLQGEFYERTGRSGHVPYR